MTVLDCPNALAFLHESKALHAGQTGHSGDLVPGNTCCCPCARHPIPSGAFHFGGRRNLHSNAHHSCHSGTPFDAGKSWQGPRLSCSSQRPRGLLATKLFQCRRRCLRLSVRRRQGSQDGICNWWWGFQRKIESPISLVGGGPWWGLGGARRNPLSGRSRHQWHLPRVVRKGLDTLT